MKPVRAAALVSLAACARSPSYLVPEGPVAGQQARLGWMLLVVGCAVIVAVGLLVLAAVLRRREPAGGNVLPEPDGERWVVIGGVVVPAVILAAVLIASTRTLAAVVHEPRAVTNVQIIGHRWWWELRYTGQDPQDQFTTANELHLPVGRPVRLELTTADVIHSFWIPQLAGKLDLVPGQHNVLYLEADSAGPYYGQCAEYCGRQHAGMGLSVVAEPPAQFSRWLDAMRRPASPPPAGDAAAGGQVFARSACALCHAVRGTGAGGGVGPDLTHVASRRTLAGRLPNRTGELMAWIADPQALKPGVLMPAVPLATDELRQVVAYLQTLR
jgi:cytochrome c oxidase subunit 2